MYTQEPWKTESMAMDSAARNILVDSAPQRFAHMTDAEIFAETEANKRLMIHSRELLEALEGVLIASEDGGDFNDVDFNGIRAAIAKAKGDK